MTGFSNRSSFIIAPNEEMAKQFEDLFPSLNIIVSKKVPMYTKRVEMSDKKFIEGLDNEELINRLNFLRYGIEPDENFGTPKWVDKQIALCISEIDKRVVELDLLSESRILTGTECATLALLNYEKEKCSDERVCPRCNKLENGSYIRNYGECSECCLDDIQTEEIDK